VIDLIKIAFVPAILSCCAALLITVANLKLRDRIDDHQFVTFNESLRRIMPSGAAILERKIVASPENDSPVYWIGIAENDTVYAFRVAVYGYAGMINYLVCTTVDGVINGLTVLEQHETPGHGGRVQEILPNRSFASGRQKPDTTNEPWFCEQFKGISIKQPITIEKAFGEWHHLDEKRRRELFEKNGITAITGSTVSARAMINGLCTKVREYLYVIRRNGDVKKRIATWHNH